MAFQAPSVKSGKRVTPFDFAFELIIFHEGGYVNDPRDPGGETKFGISDRADGIIDGKFKGKDIKTLTLEDAKKIYKEEYWLRAKCDFFNDATGIILFDMAVNMGVDAGIKVMQRALKVKEDGIIGPITIMNATKNHKVLPAQMTMERMLRYTNTKNFDRFGRGWFVRSINTFKEAVDYERNRAESKI